MTDQARPHFLLRTRPSARLSITALRQQAARQQQQGYYNLATLWLFRHCWLRSAQPRDFLAYLWFRRSLGYPLTERRAQQLQQLSQLQGWQRAWYGLVGQRGWQLQCLLAEYQDCKPGQPQPPTAPVTASGITSRDLTAQQQHWRMHQALWQQQLQAELRGCPLITLVGNGAQLQGSAAGAAIDRAGFVVRFNRCFSARSQPVDVGRQLDLWVMAPDFRGDLPDTSWLIISGPNSVWSKRHWPALPGRRVLSVPLVIWRQLVRQLAAPPSAGVLVAAYLRSLLPATSLPATSLPDTPPLHCYGVGYPPDQPTYHQADAEHPASSRHHWRAELDWWQQQHQARQLYLAQPQQPELGLANPSSALSSTLSSALSPAIKAALLQQGWYGSVTTSGGLRLVRRKPLPPGWLQLTVKGPDLDNVSLTMPQQHIPLQLLPINGGFQLIFRCYQRLDDVLLHLTSRMTAANPAENQSTPSGLQPTLTTLQLQPLPQWLAVARIFRYLWLHAAQRNEPASRIVHLSIARYRRAGAAVMLEKLLQTYQPQLAQQWTPVEPYQYWQQQIEPQLKQHVRQELRQELRHHDNPQPAATAMPHFVLVLTADAAGLWRRSIQSVLQQDYPHWQLHLRSDASLDHLATVLAEGSELHDSRISLSNDSEPRLPDITPQHWIWQLQSGDQLAADALTQLHVALCQADQTRLCYSDHDLITVRGERHQPAFKPAFAPDYLLQYNYIGAAFCYQASLWQTAASDAPTWWQQDPWLQLLQLLRHIPAAQRPTQIQHLPLVLYHQLDERRLLLAADARATPQQALVQQTLVQQAIIQLVMQDEQCQPDISVRQPGLFRLQYPLPQPAPLITLIIPTRDALALTRTCVESILRLTRYPAFEILLLDNQSSEPATLAWFSEIAQHPQVRLLSYDAPFNYSAINNFGVAQTQAPLIGLINNDTEVIHADWLDQLVQHALRPAIGCVGAKLYFADQTLQHGGVVLGLWGLAGHSHKHYPRSADGYQYRLQTVQNYSAVTAACLVMRRELFLAVGGLNEQDLTVAFNDVDLCLKVQQAGYRNLWTPDAELFHYESKSRGKEDTPAKKARERLEINYMQQQWPAQLAADRYYHPQLTRKREDFSIAVAES